ncbi:MAG TPA: dienelactone hydrolase family protein [Pseudolysinimonas sp.]|jgi:carboxymethylenebutenolidase|nr:dienelactone hydrolase family protein [Pseudolysinimonas sp.]
MTETYRAEPTGEPRGAIILIEEIWGLVGHIRDIADRFAAEGYLVLAPDLLSETGMTPEVGQRLADIRSNPDPEVRNSEQPVLREVFTAAFSPEFARVAVDRLRATVDELENEPGIDGRIAVVGFCFGGTYSYALAAADHRIRAAVPFYGMADPRSVGAISCPVLAFYGDRDERLIAGLPAVTAALGAGGVDATIQRYPDAGHAFFNDTNPLAYRPADAADAWQRTLAFLGEALGSGAAPGAQ